MNSVEARKSLVTAIESLLDSLDDDEPKLQEYASLDLEKAIDALEDTVYDTSYALGYKEGQEAGYTKGLHDAQ